MIKMAFQKDQTYRYHYRSTLNGSMTMGQGQALPIEADSSADATWKVVSVDENGNSTIDLTLANLKTSFTGSVVAGTTTTTTTTTTTQRFQFEVAPTGEIRAGGGLSVPPSALAGPTGLGLPGTDQFLAVLPDRAVKPGDTWTKTFTRPVPFSQASATYTTENRFLRYESLPSGRAAVIETTATVPLDVSLDLQQVAAQAGGPGGPPPAPIGVQVGGQVHISGTSTTDSTTWFDVKTDRVERTKTVDTTDETTTFVGISGLPSPLPTQAPPGLQGLLGPQHFTGKQTLELDLLS
jgi:hypothetical protein